MANMYLMEPLKVLTSTVFLKHKNLNTDTTIELASAAIQTFYIANGCTKLLLTCDAVDDNNPDVALAIDTGLSGLLIIENGTAQNIQICRADNPNSPLIYVNAMHINIIP